MMKNIPIFMASDDNYAPFLCTAMYSILENTDTPIDFYVLDGGISDKSKNLIAESFSLFDNYGIEYIDMSNYDLNQFPNLKHYSVNTFSRYFIANIKPNISRCLYLDVDIIVKGDIVDLYNQNLEGFPLGVVLEDFYTGNYTYLKEKIYQNYKGGSNYFNAGILVLDLKYFRENNLQTTLIKMTSDYAEKLSCPDQDVFNIVFENNFKILDYKYNFMPDHYAMFESYKSEIAKQSKQDAVVYHFTGGKPWKNESCESKLFWNIANKTKFKKIIKKKFAKKINVLLAVKKLIKKVAKKILPKSIIKAIKEKRNPQCQLYQ